MTGCERNVKDMLDPMRNSLRVEACPSTLDDVSRAVQALVGEMRGGHVDDVLPAVEITLAEVLTNVVEHGYQMRDDGWIRIKMHAGEDSVWFSILDGGIEMPTSFSPPEAMPDLDRPFDDLPEGGFGWPLIRELADKVSLRRRNGVNRLSLVFRLPQAAL